MRQTDDPKIKYLPSRHRSVNHICYSLSCEMPAGHGKSCPEALVGLYLLSLGFMLGSWSSCPNFFEIMGYTNSFAFSKSRYVTTRARNDTGVTAGSLLGG